jgi:hypothetical protein
MSKVYMLRRVRTKNEKKEELENVLQFKDVDFINNMKGNYK